MTATRLRRFAIGVVAFVVLGLSGRLIDVPRFIGNQKGDEATYVAMTTSLASDQDLRYRAEDYQRYAAEYGHGPEGIFLKRAYAPGLNGAAVPTSEYLAFGKAFIYPLAAAPFVALGGLGGMVIFNWVLVALCVWCAVMFCQARTSRVSGAVLGATFVLASDVTVFAAWLTPEVFNFALIFVAYFLWLYKKVAPPERLGWLASGWTDVAAAAVHYRSLPQHATAMLRLTA
jgi:hypothetical protein